MKFIVIDDVLTENEVEITRSFMKKIERKPVFWADKGEPVGFPLYKFLGIVEQYFDLSSMVGCEYWDAHRYDPSPDLNWHIDKDEKLYTETGEERRPLCSVVYYPHIENLKDGRFLTESHLVVPKTNRMIAFSSGLLHAVERFTGQRKSLSINPWSYKIS